MNTCYLSLGSNQNHPERQIRLAFHDIRTIPHTYISKVSSLHWTKAWGVQAQQDFCNAVVQIETRLSPQQLLRYCNMIEKQHGRVRKKRWGPRTLDIDIILYSNRVIHTRNLTIPHPHYLSREFVLKPLLELTATS